jgi:hypothetical protein
MHLGSAGIGKADVNAASNQGPHQTFRTVHPFHSRSGFSDIPRRSIIPGAFRQRVAGICWYAGRPFPLRGTLRRCMDHPFLVSRGVVSVTAISENRPARPVAACEIAPIMA